MKLTDWIRDKVADTAALTYEVATRDNNPIDGTQSLMMEASDADSTLRARGSYKAVKLYRDCEADDHCSALLQVRKNSVLKHRHEIIPGGDKRADRLAAAAISEWAEEKVDFVSVLSDLLDSTLYGYAVGEVLWIPNYKGGAQWFPRAIRSKQPWRFAYDKYMNLHLRTMNNSYEGEMFPPQKFLVCSHDVKHDNPYGTPLGQSLWWLVFFRRAGMRFWAEHGEKFGSPFLVGKYPPSANPAEQNKVVQMIARAHRARGVAVPETFGIELMAANAGNNDFYERWVEWLNRQMAVRILGSTLTTSTSDGAGSRAAGEVHERTSGAVIFADCRKLEACVNQQLFRWICEFNFPGAKPPRLHFDLPDLAAQSARAERDLKLRQLGIVPDDLGQYASRHFGINADPDRIAAAQKNFADGNNADDNKDNKTAQFAEDEFKRRQAAVVALQDDVDIAAEAAAAEVLPSAIEAIFTEAAAAKTPEELAAIVFGASENILTEDSKAAQLLETAMLNSELAGRASAG